MAFGRAWLRLVSIILSWPVLLLASIAGIGFLYNADNEAASLPFAFLAVAATAAILFLLSRRPAFSVYGAWAFMGLVTVILLMFLSNVRSALLVAVNIPLALLFAFWRL